MLILFELGARLYRYIPRLIKISVARLAGRVVFLLTSSGERVLRVVAPLGVLLPFGLGLRIDNEPIGDKPLPFIRCRAMGCISEIIVKDALLDKLKTGTEALFIIVETKEQGRAIPISLKGFAKGFEYLTTLSKAK